MQYVVGKTPLHFSWIKHVFLSVSIAYAENGHIKTTHLQGSLVWFSVFC